MNGRPRWIIDAAGEDLWKHRRVGGCRMGRMADGAVTGEDVEQLCERWKAELAGGSGGDGAA